MMVGDVRYSDGGGRCEGDEEMGERTGRDGDGVCRGLPPSITAAMWPAARRPRCAISAFSTLVSVASYLYCGMYADVRTLC